MSVKHKKERIVHIVLITSFHWKTLLLWITVVSASCWFLVCHEFLWVLPKIPMLSLCPRGSFGALWQLQTSASSAAGLSISFMAQASPLMFVEEDQKEKKWGGRVIQGSVFLSNTLFFLTGKKQQNWEFFFYSKFNLVLANEISILSTELPGKQWCSLLPMCGLKFVILI